MIERDLREILVKLEGLTQRLDANDRAYSLAREDQDEWRDEMRTELREIRAQTTATNGTVRKHEILIAQMRGVASVFSWWKAAAAGSVVAGVAYFLTTL